MASESPRLLATAGARRSLGRNVIALAAVSFLTDVSSEMIYPLLPLFLSGVLGATTGVIGAIEGAAESTAALVRLASGWWSDRLRRRKPLVLAGYVLSTVARPLVAMAGSPAQLLAVRLSDRVGKGVRSAPRDALIADSVPAAVRGRAFGFHRAADHAGAVVGPLVAFALLGAGDVSLRGVFWLAAVPGIAAVLVLALFVREGPRVGRRSELGGETPAAAAGVGPPPEIQDVVAVAARHDQSDAVGIEVLPARASAPHAAPGTPLGGRFWAYLGAVALFTLGNSTDAFLLLRATELGVPVAVVPLLWAAFHVVKSASSTPGGALSDRVGRRPMIVAGWLLYAAVYLGFGQATDAWHVWGLFGGYGVFFGLTEGAEKALVADLVPASRRGTAFGWYNLAVGLVALPASLVFGLVWQRAGAAAAFTTGGALALAAAVWLMVVTARPAHAVDRR